MIPSQKLAFLRSNVKYRQMGFTLVEVLIGLFILGAIMVAFFRIVGTTADTSNELTQRNDLIQDAQVAQQIVNARIQEACYVYPSGTVISMGTGYTTKRTVPTGASNSWTVGADQIVAMLLPPSPGSTSGRFYAYYPILRSYYITNAPAASQRPDAEPGNASNWILMEYFTTNVTNWDLNKTCSDNVAGGTLAYNTAASGNFLIDNVQPTDATGVYTQMFTINAGPPATVTFSLKMQRAVRGRQNAANSAGIVRVPPSSAADPMQTTISPQNGGL
jgi:prepilin-type N-terminal cleavage/methylation domain-containing protein